MSRRRRSNRNNSFADNQSNLPVYGAPNMFDLWPDEASIGQDWAEKAPPNDPLTHYQMKFLQSEIIDWVQFGKMVGKGGFGSVFEIVADHKQSNGRWRRKQFACKIIRHKSGQKYFIQLSLAEMVVLRYLKHKHICNMIEVFGIPDSVTGFPYSVVCLILEHCHGDLDKLYTEYKMLAVMKMLPSHTFPEHLSRHWLTHVARGLDYIHSNFVAHQDMKLPNILYRFGSFTSNTFENKFLSSTFKLGDFGISLVQIKSSVEHQQALAEDIDRLAHLLYTTGVPGPGQYNSKTIFMEKCLSGEWTDDDPQEWSTISPEMKDLMGRMADNGNRLTASQIVEHPWLEPYEEHDEEQEEALEFQLDYFN